MTTLAVLHVTPYSDRAWAYGGIPRVVADQTEALVERGLRVTVATTDVRDRDSREPRPEGGPVRRPHPLQVRRGVEVRVFPNVSNRIASRLQLYLPLGLDRWLAGAARGFAVGHLHGVHNLPGVHAARRLRAAGVPFVVQPNGTAPRHERRRLAKLAFDLLLGRRVLRDAAAVVAVTEFERRQLVGLGVPTGRVAVIPNPVDVRMVPPAGGAAALRERFGLGDAPLVVYLGQLSPRKRVDLLVRAFAGLEDRRARLVIAGGDMGCRPSLERLVAALGVGPRTTFTGVLAGTERLAALAAATVVAYPTRDEIFGLVPLEALLCGTPVVVADDCGCGEVIGRTGGGEIVSAGDLVGLTTALSRVLGSPEAWREPVAAATVRIRRWFGRATVAAELETLYRRLVEGSR